MTSIDHTGSVVLQRCAQFVGRTTNWLYDHLRFVPHYRLKVMCDTLENREEFPLLEAREFSALSMGNRIWRRLRGDSPYPLARLWIRKIAPKILHSHFGYVAVNDLKLNQMLQVPWVVSFYGADIYQVGTYIQRVQSYDRIFQQAVKVLVLGPAMRDALERSGCPPQKIVIHALGVDIESIPTRARCLKAGEDLKVLFAGTFREKKGLQYLIEGAALARKAGVRLHLVVVGDEAGKPGDREYKEKVFHTIRRLGLEQHVTHYPYISFHQLLHLAMESHIFVAPSITADDGDAEGTPFVLQQMMATGMTCVATMHSDIPFLFGEHSDLLVPERDSRAIADRLQSYTERPERLFEDGQRLRERISSAFNVRERAERLGELYDSLRSLSDQKLGGMGNLLDQLR